MKKTKVLIAKVLSMVLTISALSSSFPKVTYAAQINNIQGINKYQLNFKTGVLYEDENFKITQTETTRTVLDKKTSKTAIITFTDSNHSKGTYKDANGNVKNFSTDANGNIYLEGVLLVKANHFVKPENRKDLKNYYNPNHFRGKDGFTYYYVTEYTYNTKTAGDAVSIALGLLAFLPFLGSIFAVASIIETARNFGADTLYVIEDQYCTSDYSHYAYKNYFYSDSRHSDLIDSNIVYKKMW